jgi:hypothetical protein
MVEAKSRSVLRRFNEFLSDHNLLSNPQFGFHAAHFTSHQLNRVAGNIKTNRGSQRSTGLVLHDVEKGFDSVWHEGSLVVILNCYLYLTKIIASFLSGIGSSFHVCVHSATHLIPYGVSQGAILSPSLPLIRPGATKVKLPLSPTTLQYSCPMGTLI